MCVCGEGRWRRGVSPINCVSGVASFEDRDRAVSTPSAIRALIKRLPSNINSKQIRKIQLQDTT